jgi:glycosyltransferase involved in cell wall biosynthesis
MTLRLYGVKWLSLIAGGNALLWMLDGLKLYRRYIKLHGIPDIIHAHSIIQGGILAYKIWQRFGVPYVITEHSSAYARERINDRQKMLAADAVTHASRRFAVSEAFCAFLENYFGVDKGPWDPMPNIVNQMFAEVPIQPLAQGKEEFSFVTIAGLKKIKGIDDLIKAFARAYANEKNVKLVIGGDGPERRQLGSLVQALGLVDRVHFLGRLNREQVLKQLVAADVYVSSSHYETFGVAVVEALALGKPVVATRCGGPNSIVRNLDGLLVEPYDVDALSDALINIQCRIDSYDPEEIRRACIDRYGEAIVTARLIKSYKNILDVPHKDVVRSI